MTIIDILKLKPQEIADACQGNETTAYTLLRAAVALLRVRIEERMAADRVHANLTLAANSAPPLVKLFGLKWALVRP